VELIRGWHNVRSEHRGCVLTIGNFDGVHLGHQAILKQLGGVGRARSLTTTLITFEPHPREYFAPENAPARLSRLREKLCALRHTLVERVLCLRFDAKLARLSAEEFVSDLLVGSLGARYVLVGDDFRFGYQRAGDLALLKKCAPQLGFEVGQVKSRRVGERRVSSTWLRSALEQGDFDTVQALLRRPYYVCGRVLPGDRRGRTLGFPTANIALRRTLLPLSGVHAVQVLGLSEDPLPGLANVGVRPTVGGKRTLLEVHLLDFNQEIYGREVKTEFLWKIRDERRFASIEVLRSQIERDADSARGFFARRHEAVRVP
jgi:riboflavin kinase/FMN adenylyltransferase